MDKKFQILKKTVGIILRQAMKPFMIIALIVCIVIVSLAGFNWVIDYNDAVYKSGDKKNVPYTTEQHTSNVKIAEDGTITTAQTALELWNEMLKNESRVNEYLDSPEELLKMMNAQMVTNYLDTRENPEEPIDWKKINKDINSKQVQGIIKLKRAFDDGTTSIITYVDPETFQGYIDEYNQNGSEEAKQKALHHFTLEKGYIANSSFGAGASITAGTVITIPAGLGSVHTYMGWQTITSTSSTQYKLREQAGMNFDSEGFGRINGRYVIACTTTFGQVGDYIDFYQEDGSVIQCIIGDIKNQSDAGCNEWGHLNGTCIVEFVVNKDTWYNSNHPNPGQQGFHMEWNQNLTKAINGGNYFDNPNFANTNSEGTEGTTTGNNTISGETMKWPTEGTNITSYFGIRDNPTNSGATENHGAIDIAVPTGTNVYATEAGTVVTAGMNGPAGNLVTIDHGNGYITKYMHNSSIKVSVGDKVGKGQVIALSGDTGRTTGPHVHFQIEYNGIKVDPLTFKYDNGMGNGTGGIGSNINSLSTTNTIYAKVATWNEVTDKVESNDPSVENYTTKRYNMTSTKINYQGLVSKYQMPFDYLWSLLVVGQQKEFVLELAELVYGSEMEITVHDNLKTVTDVSNDTYTKKTKVVTDDVTVNVTYMDIEYVEEDTQAVIHEKTTGHATEVGGPFEDESEVTYTTIHTVITKTNTLDVSLTKANTWIVDYSQEYTYQIPEPVITPSNILYEDEEYKETPDQTDSNDAMGLAESYRQSVESSYQANHDEASATLASLTSQYFNKIVNRNINITNTVEEKKYVPSPATVKEKTDAQAKEPNFVTLFLKHRKFQNNIKSAPEWIFKILEDGKNTGDFVDLTKYLLYKATNRDYGVKEFDFSIFNVEDFDPISNVGSFTGDTVNSDVYNFPRYLQKDYPGSYGTSTIPRAGCGPTSLAMILAGLKNDASINPQTVVANIKNNWPNGSYYVTGVGSSHCIFQSGFLQKYYGVTSQMYPSDSVALEALEKGYPVIGGETRTYIGNCTCISRIESSRI